MKKNIIIAFATFIAFFCLNLIGQSTGSSVDALKSENLVQRRAEIKFLKEQRVQRIDDLIAVLNGKFSLEIKDSAAIALGDCRASEAVDALIQNIGLDVRGRVIKGFLPVDEMFPVLTSLEKIGNPSIPVIIRFLGEKGSFSRSAGTLDEQRNAEASVLLLRTLCQIDGDKEIVQLRLQKASAAETDPQKRDRLQLALKALKDVPMMPL